MRYVYADQTWYARMRVVGMVAMGYSENTDKRCLDNIFTYISPIEIFVDIY